MKANAAARRDREGAPFGGVAGKKVDGVGNSFDLFRVAAPLEGVGYFALARCYEVDAAGMKPQFHARALGGGRNRFAVGPPFARKIELARLGVV